MATRIVNKETSVDADTIDQLQAGRELDALVAERVMGWQQKVPAYSTDIAAAWEVLKKAAADSTTSLNVYRVDYEGEPWQCIFVWVDGEWYQKAGGSASTASLAICRAALKVINNTNNANDH